MATEIAFRNGMFPDAATLPKASEAEATAVSPRGKKTDPDLRLESETAILPFRPSQSAIDRVYQVKHLAILATALATALVLFSFSAFVAVPWYGENILKPESQGRVQDAHALTHALETFAEASKVSAANDAKNDETLIQIREQIKLFSAVAIELRNEIREMRKEQ